MVIDKEMARLFELCEVEMEAVQVALRVVYGEVVMAEESRYSANRRNTQSEMRKRTVRECFIC